MAYYWQCSNIETARYYFAQAIPWLFECMEFKDNSADINRNLINSVAQRYRDIAFISSADEIEKIYSLKLALAFEKAAQEL